MIDLVVIRAVSVLSGFHLSVSLCRHDERQGSPADVVRMDGGLVVPETEMPEELLECIAEELYNSAPIVSTARVVRAWRTA